MSVAIRVQAKKASQFHLMIMGGEGCNDAATAMQI